MKPSKALLTIRERAKEEPTVIRRPRKTGYKKTRGTEQQGLYDRIVAYALSCPLSTITEIAKDTNTSSNAVSAALKEAGIRKAKQNIGKTKVPWIKLTDLLDKPIPTSALPNDHYIPNPDSMG